MKKLRSHFQFNKQERSGIFYLLAVIFLMQLSFFIIKSVNFNKEFPGLGLNEIEQERIDSLLAAAEKTRENYIKTSNPNYISDFKGYELGMSLEEIDRLHQFRASGKYINSSDQFQSITQVHDTLLEKILPFIRFPKKPARLQFSKTKSSAVQSPVNLSSSPRQDLNTATEEDLKKIYGIGEVLSARIIKFRRALGGFLINDQLFDVYGLDSAVVRRLIQHFEVKEPPDSVSIDLNKASEAELSQNIYISRAFAKQIVRLRDSLGKIDSLEQLTKIQDFPSDKIERIKLYLTL